MRRALRLAERGRGRVNPNPMVGAVVVRAGRVVGEGWHRAPGAPHAEAMALARAGARARGATMYVTLEPCAHVGRTPPCVDAIIAGGVRRCVVAIRDPHAIVDGRGLRRLRAAGVRVEVGLFAAEVEAQLAGYLMTQRSGRPRVTLKLATSLDGRIAPARGFARRGADRWLTGPAARRLAHRLRARSDAVVVGAGTARADDPRLTARGVGAARQPLRVVCDTMLRLPVTLALLRDPGRTVIACGPRAPRRRQTALEARGARVWRLGAGRGSTRAAGVPPAALLRRLARAGCHEVLIEGGAALAGAWLDARVVDRIVLMIAPTLLGRGGLAWGPSAARRGRFAALGRAGSDAVVVAAMEA
ncbi:MAG: bifunctional diaminohydroxyphosphoribosylaminopyrimidine deaminase/5-amino-6-(5-phosphoribosylamino)uracil reductase RibD [Candidatus Eisenbacteria bacterium]|nr:bifunctional diaminohydroxyphosphoribosylaminopyrimidine deaminase/5-amino-6-(5-phosphoribosylamino)uracil reductase RibD [Candidatus Eisenbacteria bacterium]